MEVLRTETASAISATQASIARTHDELRTSVAVVADRLTTHEGRNNFGHELITAWANGVNQQFQEAVAKQTDLELRVEVTNNNRIRAEAEHAAMEKNFNIQREKMHSDLQKSAKDSTLEHSLFAAFNTD